MTMNTCHVGKTAQFSMLYAIMNKIMMSETAF